jgi:hypothetical protein
MFLQFQELVDGSPVTGMGKAADEDYRASVDTG